MQPKHKTHNQTQMPKGHVSIVVTIEIKTYPSQKMGGQQWMELQWDEVVLVAHEWGALGCQLHGEDKRKRGEKRWEVERESGEIRDGWKGGSSTVGSKIVI